MAETVFPQAGAPAARPGGPIQLAGQGGVPRLTLVSHKLCPYVQRVAIVLAEKGLPYERIYIDLAHKPRWFLELSPLGKTPLLKVETGTGDAHVVFESAVIAEFLEDVFSHPMHPVDPLARAGHRGWVEVASSILNGIARLYGARDAEVFEREWQGLRAAFERVEAELSQAGRRPYFGG
ncbi:glutathione S-transferase family protein [Ovoidimarina sediminis]|uniref:glutathione S-transferase family protein n=1 Tax=Ovoidimarina sediminis TaxID=3079856 RepID=UPI0029138EB7|nr:glutathione S-transferase family protein [Rhodophyticola sp. MJ-SS7]MDU8943533.1 glutathione S-transferase family protein [Rhodophyticola sp. MJ-SS7]